MHATTLREVATLGGGCYWCLEAVFEQLKGVEKVESGFAGGSAEHPTYEQVCGEDTGHADRVMIVISEQSRAQRHRDRRRDCE